MTRTKLLLRAEWMLAIATLLLFVQTTNAQVITCWGFSSNTLFNNPANWNNGVPGNQDTAKFFVGVPITVTMNVDASVEEFDHVIGRMTLTGGNRLKVSSSPSIDTEMIVTGSETVFELQTDLNIATADSGELTIQDKSILEVAGIMRIANEAGLQGELLVRNAGTLVDVDQFRVGQSGVGILDIEDGATVLTNRSRIGFGTASIGNASISGAGSVWETSTSMNLGHFGGTGTLNILTGSVMVGTELNIANALDSTGLVNMFGGELEAPEMFVGREGDGSLDLRGGIANITDFVTIADGPDANGTANVILSGRLETESLAVANEGVGMLNISSGGEVIVDGIALVGAMAGSFGSICVGQDGSLDCGALGVGGDGDGELIIENGGEVSVDGIVFVAPNFEIDFPEDGGTLEAGIGVQIAGRVAFSSGDSEIIGDIELINDGVMIVGPAGGSVGRVDGTLINNGDRISVPGGTQLFALGQVTGSSPFEGTGLVQLAGGLSPGNGIGSIEFDCDADFGTGAQIFIELGGTAAGSQHDQIRFNDISLAGTLNVIPVNGFQPTPGQQFTIMEIDGNRLGTINGLGQGSVAATIGNTNLEIDYFGGDGNDVVLNAVSAGILLGDVNLDGNVDLLDVSPFVQLISNGGFQAEADINGDGTVDLLDVQPFVQILSN